MLTWYNLPYMFLNHLAMNRMMSDIALVLESSLNSFLSFLIRINLWYILYVYLIFITWCIYISYVLLKGLWYHTICIYLILHHLVLLHITAKKSIIFRGRRNFCTINIKVKSFMHLFHISFPEPSTFGLSWVTGITRYIQSYVFINLGK